MMSNFLSRLSTSSGQQSHDTAVRPVLPALDAALQSFTCYYSLSNSAMVWHGDAPGPSRREGPGPGPGPAVASIEAVQSSATPHAGRSLCAWTSDISPNMLTFAETMFCFHDTEHGWGFPALLPSDEALLTVAGFLDAEECLHFIVDITATKACLTPSLTHNLRLHCQPLCMLPPGVCGIPLPLAGSIALGCKAHGACRQCRTNRPQQQQHARYLPLC